MMDHMVDQDNHCYYWPFNAVHQLDELDSYFGEMCVGGQSQSDSNGGFSAAPKNIVSERNRRKKLNETLYALRSAVPNITKMDKASIIKDAIEYIESMHAKEKRIRAEISEMEWGGASMAMDHHPDSTAFSAQTSNCYDYSSASTSTTTTNSFAVESSHHPIQLLELRVSSMAEKIIMVSLSCSKGRDTMVKLCDIFESLDLKIISANITSLSGRLLNTLFLEGDDNEKEALSFKIKAAIAALNDPDSPNCI